MPQFDMVYNTQKADLIISEYGRNVQDLIHQARSIEDRAHRQRCVEQVVNLINIMNPHNRNLEDYKEKLWNHVMRIAEYNLDVDVPEGITIHKDVIVKLDAHLPYPQTQFAFRHYGSYIQNMIAIALQMEPGPKRQGYSQAIASYMKLAYLTWNKEHFVSDEVIKLDLLKLSKGQLTFDDNYSIENLVSAKALAQSQKNNNNNKGSRFKKNSNNNAKSNRRNFGNRRK
jgi:hypothetical protein